MIIKKFFCFFSFISDNLIQTRLDDSFSQRKRKIFSLNDEDDDEEEIVELTECGQAIGKATTCKFLKMFFIHFLFCSKKKAFYFLKEN